jgi:radical SAM superfamily enzyme YgiQ (UPF0313 family)
MKLAHEIKKNKDITIIMGNVHATLMPQDFIFKNSPVDYVVIGEGELTASELIKNLESGKELSDTKGLAYLKDGKYFQTEKRALIDDLSILPRPCYEKINMDFYLTPTKSIIRNLYLSAVTLHTGRGCAYKCEFCAANTVWNQNVGKCVRYRPIDNVIDEIEYLKNTYDIDAFYILDDTFTLHKERVYEFCAKLKSKKLDLIWGAETRVNLIDEKMVRTMKDAGCIQLDFGVESGSQKMLDKIKKGQTVEDIKNAFEICRKNGVRTFANMLANLPGESEDDLLKSEKIMDEIKATRYSVGITTPYPGTPIYQKYTDPKLSRDEYPLLLDNRLHASERFRMAAHNLDLNKILLRWSFKYKIYSLTPCLTKEPLYWRTVSKSKRKWKIIRELMTDYIVTPVGYMLNAFRYIRTKKYAGGKSELCRKNATTL